MEPTIKSNARILDATAGNRCIWREKDDPRILFMDIEPALERRPDIVMDCSKTNYPDKSFTHIFFDPPHNYGKKLGDFWTIKNPDDYKKVLEMGVKFKRDRTHSYSYYGEDKYRNKTELLEFINRAFLEFYRILDDNGLLMLKWNEYKIPVSRVLTIIFDNWIEMMRLEIGDAQQSLSKSRTYWIVLMKRRTSVKQLNCLTQIQEAIDGSNKGQGEATHPHREQGEQALQNDSTDDMEHKRRLDRRGSNSKDTGADATNEIKEDV